MPSIPSRPAERSVAAQINDYITDLSKSPNSQQLLIGSSSGLFCGYLSSKVGRLAAITGGVSLLLLIIAKDRGYIKFNDKKLSADIEDLRRKIEQNFNVRPNENEVVTFVKKYSYLLGGFAGGFLIGWGVA